MITIQLTDNQAHLVLLALYNESIDDPAEFGEYSYGRCFADLQKKINKAYESEGGGQ